MWCAKFPNKDDQISKQVTEMGHVHHYHQVLLGVRWSDTHSVGSLYLRTFTIKPESALHCIHRWPQQKQCSNRTPHSNSTAVVTHMDAFCRNQGRGILAMSTGKWDFALTTWQSQVCCPSRILHMLCYTMLSPSSSSLSPLWSFPSVSSCSTMYLPQDSFSQYTDIIITFFFLLHIFKKKKKV